MKNHAEYMEMVRNGITNVVKWGTYTDSRWVQNTQNQDMNAGGVGANGMNTGMNNGMDSYEESYEDSYEDEAAFIPDPIPLEKDPALAEAEAIAARVQAQAESRIQDNVSKLISELQD